MTQTSRPHLHDVIVVGAGLAGLSAGIYLGRALRDVLIVSAGNSMAVWEPDVQNYLGFPEGVNGGELVNRGRSQAARFRVQFAEDEIDHASIDGGEFVLRGRETYRSRRLLLATGIYHLPPEIPGVKECLGHSMFFCKDCDGYRVQGKRLTIYGNNNEAVEYALGMLTYSASVFLATDGKLDCWSSQHGKWLAEYHIPIYREKISEVEHDGCELRALRFQHGEKVAVDCLFTTRGDIYYNELAHDLGANIDSDTGEIITDHCLRTSVPGLYAAGCVTAANCQMIIAAGQGAIAGQAINRDLFEESLRTNSLRTARHQQITRERTEPHVIELSHTKAQRHEGGNASEG
jgi:thioredoxin reductase (NADPH)